MRRDLPALCRELSLEVLAGRNPAGGTQRVSVGGPSSEVTSRAATGEASDA